MTTDPEPIHFKRNNRRSKAFQFTILVFLFSSCAHRHPIKEDFDETILLGHVKRMEEQRYLQDNLNEHSISYYQENGALKLKEYFKKDSLIQKDSFTYNAQNYLVLKLTVFPGLDTIATRYRYGKLGCTEIEESNGKTSLRTKYTYNSAGNVKQLRKYIGDSLVARVDFDYSDDQTYNISYNEEQFPYNKSRIYVHPKFEYFSIEYTLNVGDKRAPISNKSTAYFDSLMNITKQVDEMNSRITSIYNYTYEFDNIGNWTTKFEYLTDPDFDSTSLSSYTYRSIQYYE